MSTKSLTRFAVKDPDKGEVEAVFSTFNVIDADMDVTLPGAFEDGAPVRISAYNHASSMGQKLPVGRGTIRTTSTEAILTGKFFMDVPAAADTFRVVKGMGDLQEWSYHYDAVKFSFGEFEGRRVRFLEQQKVNEVSPVLLGAGIDTRTLAAKTAGMTFADEAHAVLTAVTRLSERAADVMAKRAEKGKALGVESSALLQQVKAELDRLAKLLAEPEPTDVAAELQREYLRMVARQTRREAPCR